MNFKRALGYSVLLWVIIFVAITIVMFLPWFKDSQLRTMVAWWILEIPIVLFWCKLYFKTDSPTVKKGFYLGLSAIMVGTILDAIITVPLFVKSYATFYGSWMLYVGYALTLTLTTYAGFEFDRTYTKSELSGNKDSRKS